MAFTATALVAFIAKQVNKDFAEFVAPFLSGFAVALPEFCSVDPPTAPTITQDDLFALLPIAPPQGKAAALQKLQDWFGAMYWCTACQCDNGTPVSCTPGTTPTDVPQSDTGLPSTGPVGSCWTSTPSETISLNASTPVNYDRTAAWLPTSLGTHSETFAGSLTVTAAAIPSGAQRFSGSITLPTDPDALEFDIRFWDASNTPTSPSSITLHLFAAGATGTANFTGTVPSGAAWAAVTAGNGSGSHDFTYSAVFNFDCGNTTDLNTTCCAPDPTVETKLEAIYQLLLQTYSIIPVRAPNYAAGTAHSSLSGNGTVALDSATIAVRVDITSFPVGYGQEAGNPDAFFEVGWITPVTNEGGEASVRIHHSQEIFPLPEATSSVDYQLPTGEQITITELQAG